MTGSGLLFFRALFLTVIDYRQGQRAATAFDYRQGQRAATAACRYYRQGQRISTVIDSDKRVAEFDAAEAELEKLLRRKKKPAR